MIFVTGGAGFIGSNFVHSWIAEGRGTVVNIDKLTYAGNIANLNSLKEKSNHLFYQGDIVDRKFLEALFNKYQPEAVFHFAAETHVDRSIDTPEPFIQTNVVGTLHLLQAALSYWHSLTEGKKQNFRFIHISTDEVYGSLSPEDAPFTEESRYETNSPYSASKAASDHLVHAFYATYGFPAIVTHSSNNYGPYQYPEKIVPLMIMNAVEGKPLPIYGDGLNIRNWIYVDDHCAALRLLLAQGVPGETYNIGDLGEVTNLKLVKKICHILDEIKPASQPHDSLIHFVKDRPGHDRRYAIDSSKIRRELGWIPQGNFDDNMRKTVEWYLNNRSWVEQAKKSGHDWFEKHYSQEIS